MSAGSIVVVEGDVDYQRLVLALNECRAAMDELSHAKADLVRVSDNIRNVIGRLSEMQVALCADPPDLCNGAGASSLFGGLTNAMFHWSTLVFIQRNGCAAPCRRDSAVHNNSAVVHDIASGVAFHDAEGLRLRQGILRLQSGVELL